MSELLLAIEILSPSTDHVDRGRKRQLYMESGVPEYSIVDLDARSIEVWRPGVHRAEIVSSALVWRPRSVAGAPLNIRADALFAEALGPLAAT
jgi:Uma2 family endonuclease